VGATEKRDRGGEREEEREILNELIRAAII
jgi:hypothetical protein